MCSRMCSHSMVLFIGYNISTHFLAQQMWVHSGQQCLLTTEYVWLRTCTTQAMTCAVTHSMTFAVTKVIPAAVAINGNDHIDCIDEITCKIHCVSDIVNIVVADQMMKPTCFNSATKMINNSISGLVTLGEHLRKRRRQKDYSQRNKKRQWSYPHGRMGRSLLIILPKSSDSSEKINLTRVWRKKEGRGRGGGSENVCVLNVVMLFDLIWNRRNHAKTITQVY